MPETSAQPQVPLPKEWPHLVQTALLHVIALAQYALVHARGWAANSASQRVRLAANADQSKQEVALLREEARIKDARFARIPANQRPHYTPCERLAILEVRAPLVAGADRQYLPRGRQHHRLVDRTPR